MTEHIQIKSIPPRIQYIADGILSTFEFSFAIFKAENMNVYCNDVLQDSDTYTVSFDTDTAGGTVTFTTVPEKGSVITLFRNLDIERTTDFQEGGALRASALNYELDYQIACQQQIADNLNRSMVLPPYATDTDIDLTLPTPSAGKAIVWNADGTNLENSAVEINVLESTLRSYRDTAIVKADEATAQATQAINAAETATQKATEAATSAANAEETMNNKANINLDNLTEAGQTVIATAPMPSENYIDYSYTSGNNYTAPKNGYFYLRGTSGGSGAYLAISLGTASSSADYMTVKSDSGNTLCATIPVACGSIVTPTHGNITISTWRFYYAKGENV